MTVPGQVDSVQRLSAHLIAAGKLKAADIENTRKLAESQPQSLGMLLTRVGLISDRDLADAYSEIYGRPLLADDAIPIVPPADHGFKESFLRDGRILPLESDESRLSIATADPENRFALEALAMAARKPVSYLIGTVSQIEKALDHWYGDGDDEALVVGGEAGVDDHEAVDRLRDLASEAPVVRLVSSMIQRAVEARASDIHVEPAGGGIRFRYRIDGILQTVEAPQARPAAVVSRIKLMAKMNIAERRLPQDGRVHIRVQGARIDLRVSTIPTIDGESVVLRILDQDHATLELETLGFDSTVAETVRTLIEAPHGIILVTGPTGSGKTTTLYAVLQRLNSTARKILTIEDPVEYQLEGINQVQVKAAIGLDFPQALRSIVRQDPDVIMIGEMRDLETARIAVQSALTGHLVFSTLHTNDAGSSITRLLDMGVEDYLVTSSVNAVIAQRLVRQLCAHCRRAYTPPSALVDKLELDALSSSGHTTELYAAEGCDACDGTGYRGRTVIAELLLLDDRLRQGVLTRADGKTLERLAVEAGMQTMKTDGLKKALGGLTTIEEVTRVTQA